MAFFFRGGGEEKITKLTSDAETSYQPDNEKKKLKVETKKCNRYLASFIKRLMFRSGRDLVLTMICMRWSVLSNPTTLSH